MIVSPVAIVAEIGFVEESSERIAAVVMPVFLDKSYDLARGRCGVSGKDDHVWGVDGHDFDLMVGQSGLKSCEFGAGPTAHTNPDRERSFSNTL